MKFKLIRAQHYDIVTDDIIKTLLKIAFYSLPLSIWKASELIVEFLKVL
jgi:hypothetical protein